MLIKAISRFIAELEGKEIVHEAERELLQEASCLERLFAFKLDPASKDDYFYHTLFEELKKNQNTHVQRALLFIDAILKTNYFVRDRKALGFRLDPKVLMQKDLQHQFAHKPFGLFYVYEGNHQEGFFGFHIRFQDLARGGLRTVIAKNEKDRTKIAPTILKECFDLAWTQQKKNKDIPEGGAKGIVFVSNREMLYSGQKAFIETLLALVNCHDDGTLKLASSIVDYYKKPEYIYLGPDEHMHDSMIDWIAQYSASIGYKPGIAFISGKPGFGINHKQYGVTSLGVTVCMDEALRFVGINPLKDTFSVKMAGGPDGDVAGNQIVNFYASYPKTCKLVALIDVSGVIDDPRGLDLAICRELFLKGCSIHHYPKEKLSHDGFLLDKEMRKGDEVELAKKQEGRIEKIWLSEKEAEEILLWHVHKKEVDLFIPAGGRPATLNKENVADFLNAKGQPTAKVIIEGANLYLTEEARLFLEERGALIIKDSSANKGGVICSSFEVLASLALKEDEFLLEKEALVAEIRERITKCARDEVKLILQTHKETGRSCVKISEEISERINSYTAQILDYEAEREWTGQEDDPLLFFFFAYALPCLRTRHKKALLEKVPESHKKAIIAAYLASELVYLNGLNIPPTITSFLPGIIESKSLIISK
jgi:glutamate dehydrogenase